MLIYISKALVGSHARSHILIKNTSFKKLFQKKKLLFSLEIDRAFQNSAY